MGLDLTYADGQTLLDEDEKEGLLIKAIATREELDEFEQQNIEQAFEWSLKRTFKMDEIFTEKFLRKLHKKMFGKVWDWAGEFRKTNKNIGVDKWQIAIELKALLDDAKFWITEKTFEPEELAIRFKHRLVSIHCFSNGNGRHSRLVADIIIEEVFRRPVFSWGAGESSTEMRRKYLAGMKAGDRGDFEPLIQFVRS